MNRGRRAQKPFVSGGVYNPNANSVASSRSYNNFSNNAKSATQNTTVHVQQQPQLQQMQQLQHNHNNQSQQSNNEFRHERSMVDNNADVEAANVAVAKIDMNDDMEITDANGKLHFKKIFSIRKKPSVRAKEKRIRQNRQLRKSLLPKNALMALNEIRGIEMGECHIEPNATDGGFIATLNVNNTEYIGKGNSKASAKNDACEKALRDYVIAKMITKPRIRKQSLTAVNGEPMDESANEIPNDKDESNDDDVPMMNLASFAIYKLFTEWEREGFAVPELHPAAGPPAVPSSNASDCGSVKEPKIRTELPPNWETMHPATLLCQMRPGCVFSDLGGSGDKMQVIRKVGITIDGQEFLGTGRSKKIARRNAAVFACNALFNTNFIKEDPSTTA